nr:EpsG family protein [Secundilactobacillus mixtipabuli]
MFYYFTAIMHLSLLLGLRSYTVGTDTPSYVSFYIHQANNFNQNGSAIYIFLEKIVWRFVGNNYHGWLFVISFITILLIMLSFSNFSRQYNFIFLNLYIYISFFFYFESFNIQRQFLAISVTMLSVSLLDRRKWFISFLLIIIAVGIHSTAIVMFAAFLIKFIKKNKRNFIIVSACSMGSALSLNILNLIFSRLFIHYEIYNDVTSLSSKGGSFFLGFFVFVMLLVGIYISNILDESEASFLVFLTAIGSVLYMVGMKSQLIVRIANYFIVYAALSLPLINFEISKRFVQKRVVFLILTSLVMFVGIIIFIYKLSGNYGDIIPYSMN